MLNMNLIEATVKEVNDYYEAEGISECNATIYNRAIDWYNHTEIVDAKTLAAVTMFGNYLPISISAIETIKDFFYPEV